MSGDAFKRATGGDALEISAASWNACLDAAEAHKRGPARPVAAGPKQFRQADVVLVQNASGGDAQRFGVLGIDGVVFPPDLTGVQQTFQNTVALRGVNPTLAAHRGRFCVLVEPIASGKIGRAWVSGVCAAKVDRVELRHQFCDVADNDRTRLRSAPAGAARILCQNTSSILDEWCVIRIGGSDGPTHRLCKAPPTESFLKGTIKTLAVWEDGTPPGETQTSAAYVHDVVNKYADIAAGKWVSVALHGNGRWYVVSAEC